MAKNQTAAADSAPAELQALAAKCVRAVTGCGKPEADARIAKMDAAKVAKLAEIENSGHRRPAVKLLYS